MRKVARLEAKLKRGGLTVAEVKDYKRAQSRLGVAARAAEARMAVLIGSARRSTVPLSSCVGTQMRRDKAAGARTGPIEARERAMVAIAEFAEAHLEVGFCTPGRRTLQPGRETCMVDRLKTMVGHGGEVLGRGGARAALILAATRGIFEMVTVAVGQGGAVVDPVKRATEWLVAQGWVEAGGVGSLEKEARGWVRVLPPHMPVVLELGMGWMGFSDPARHAMEAEGGRVVTVDERQQDLGDRGFTVPEVLATFSQGRTVGLIHWCSRRARFSLDDLWGVFISPNCTEESQASFLPGGRRGQKRNRTAAAEEAIDTMVEGVQQLLEEHPEVGVFIEQPQGSSLRGDKRMSTLGLRVVELDGRAYGLQHQKPYVLWTNLSVQEFSPRVTEQFCPYCAARPKQQHPQGMCPKKGSSQPRVRLLGYSVDAARNRMPWDLGEAIVEGFALRRQRCWGGGPGSRCGGGSGGWAWPCPG